MALNNFSLKSDHNHLTFFSQKTEKYWGSLQKKNSLDLFHKMSKGVVAYKNLLSNSNIDPNKILKFSDLSSIPLLTKKNYYSINPLKDIVWQGLLEKQGQVMTATSGSTGSPTYFPRTEAVDGHYSVLAELFLKNGPKGTTLLVNCFGMGVWIGGLITYQAFRMTALRGHAVTVITPGINKTEIFNSLRKLCSSFDNIILAGYPPFIKDILDETKSEKINFKNSNLRLLFAAESFSESFRDYVGKVGNIRNVHLDTLNIYGSAELGAMAFETPGSIFIRRMAIAHSEIYDELFHNQKVPTLAQYNPRFIEFEEFEGRVIITANTAAPFMRYDIGDNGGVFKLSDIVNAFDRNGIDLKKEAAKNNIPLWNLPFIYVHERSDFSTTLYGLQVYPQTIKAALENRSLDKFVTGKFNMKTIYDKKSNQYLELNIELKPKIEKNGEIELKVEKLLIETLIKYNSEFKELTKILSLKRTKPKLVFWPYNHDTHFRSGIKQKWLIK